MRLVLAPAVAVALVVGALALAGREAAAVIVAVATGGAAGAGLLAAHLGRRRR